MGRQFKTDTTDVYRQKVTVEGTHRKDGWGYKAGDHYKYESFYVPYMSTNVGGEPYFPGDATKVVIEVQKLGVVASELMWLTQKMKVIEPDD